MTLYAAICQSGARAKSVRLLPLESPDPLSAGYTTITNVKQMRKRRLIVLPLMAAAVTAALMAQIGQSYAQTGATVNAIAHVTAQGAITMWACPANESPANNNPHCQSQVTPSGNTCSQLTTLTLTTTATNVPCGTMYRFNGGTSYWSQGGAQDSTPIRIKLWYPYLNLPTTNCVGRTFQTDASFNARPSNCDSLPMPVPTP